MEYKTTELNDRKTDARDIEIIDDETFSYKGYQVVRGEFFAHIYEPSFTFSGNKVFVNTACIKKLPEVDYVQILVNPETKKLAVRPCSEQEKDSFRWSSGGKRIAPKQITCRIFFAKVFTLMGWNPDYRYKLLGKLIRSKGELLFVFDLTTPEIFVRTVKEGEKPKISRTPTYPAEWQTQFGQSVEEHQKNIQINIFDGYAVFGLEDTSRKKTKDSESLYQKREVKAHEQSRELQTSNMY